MWPNGVTMTEGGRGRRRRPRKNKYIEDQILHRLTVKLVLLVA